MVMCNVFFFFFFTNIMFTKVSAGMSSLLQPFNVSFSLI